MNEEEQQNKISYEQFIQLSQEEQDQLIYKYGVNLAERKEEMYDVYLWQLWSFYAEVFQKKDFSYIEKISVHNNDEILGQYIDNIKIDL